MQRDLISDGQGDRCTVIPVYNANSTLNSRLMQGFCWNCPRALGIVPLLQRFEAGLSLRDALPVGLPGHPGTSSWAVAANGAANLRHRRQYSILTPRNYNFLPSEVF